MESCPLVISHKLFWQSSIQRGRHTQLCIITSLKWIIQICSNSYFLLTQSTLFGETSPLSDGSRTIDKMALSEFIDRDPRPGTRAASCWESGLMDPKWMRGQTFPLVVRAPPFAGGNLNQNLYQYYCRTDVPFICCHCSLGNGSRLWRWFFGQQELPSWTSYTVSCLNQPIFDQPAG